MPLGRENWGWGGMSGSALLFLIINGIGLKKIMYVLLL